MEPREPGAFDLALAHAALREASEGRSDQAVRIYRPQAAMAVFGRRDVRAVGFPHAVRAARKAGFEPAVRVTGGRAVAYTSSAIVVDIVQRQSSAMLDQEARFQKYGNLFVAAFKTLGIDARLGAVPGEYCPGAHSVNARGTAKLVGTSQRVVRDAWLFSALVVVDDRELIRSVLAEIYPNLDQPFDPDSVGTISDEAPGVSTGDVEGAISDALGIAASHDDRPEDRLVARAKELLHHHDVR